MFNLMRPASFFSFCAQVGDEFPNFKTQITDMAAKRAKRFGLKVNRAEPALDPIVGGITERLEQMEKAQDERLGKIEECLQVLMNR